MLSFFKVHNRESKISTLQGFLSLTLLKTTELFLLSITSALISSFFFLFLNPITKLFFFFFFFISAIVMDFFVNASFMSLKIGKLNFSCRLSSILMGCMIGDVINFFGLANFFHCVVSAVLIFSICTVYGYVTNKDLSKLSGIISVLSVSLFTLIIISGVLSLGTILSQNSVLIKLYKTIASIETLVAFVLNVIFLPYFVHMNKTIFLSNRSNILFLRAQSIFSGYILWRTLFNLVLLLIRISNHRKRD